MNPSKGAVASSCPQFHIHSQVNVGAEENPAGVLSFGELASGFPTPSHILGP